MLRPRLRASRLFPPAPSPSPSPSPPCSHGASRPHVASTVVAPLSTVAVAVSESVSDTQPSSSPSRGVPKPAGYWHVHAHRRALLASVAAALGFAEHDYAAWARVRVAAVRALGAGSLLRYYAGSLRALLADVYPDHAWGTLPLPTAAAGTVPASAPPVPAAAVTTPAAPASAAGGGAGSSAARVRVRVPRHYWASRASHVAFVSAYAAAHSRDVHDVHFWYGVSAEALRRAGGASVLQRYAGSVAQLLTTLFPALPWDTTRFHARTASRTLPVSGAPHARAFLDALAATLGLGADRSAWYAVTHATVRAHGGAALLQLHGNSLVALLQHAYPEHAWERAGFVHKPQRYWRDPAHARAFLERVAALQGLPASLSSSHWYALQASELRRHGGAGLLHAHGGSVAAVLAAAFPAHTWHAAHFVTRPRRYWAHPAAQRAFLDALATQLGHTARSDWYSVSAATVRAHGGRALLQRYAGSLAVLLASVYPEHAWQPDAFGTVRGVWSSAAVQRAFLDALAPRLGFPAHALASWYGVTAAELSRLGGGGLRVRWQGSLAALLRSAYPEHTWDATRFARTPKHVL